MNNYSFSKLLIILIISNNLFAQKSKEKLTKYSKEQLYQDFDITVNSLKEAHTGLYWYNTYTSFDSIVKTQRVKIKDSLTSKTFILF